MSNSQLLNSSRKRRLIYVLVDGMRDDTAARHMGYVEGLVEQRVALRARVKSILPSMSRPCYEAIATGTLPVENGIVGNHVVKLSKMQSIFHRLTEEGQTSAIVAFHWWSELYHQAPFDLARDCEQNQNPDSFTYGRFYNDDSFPDVQAFALAESLRRRHDPSFLLIHPSGVDDAGHKFGAGSKQYDSQVSSMDALISRYVPAWLDAGYHVIVNSDHGMNDLAFHGGTDSGERLTPFYLMGPDVKTFGKQDNVLDQTVLADFFCRLLSVSPAPTMHRFPDDLYRAWVE